MSDEDEDLEDSDEDDADEVSDDDGEALHEYDFDDETEGVLVAGKRFDISGMMRRDLGAFAAHVDELAEKHGLALSVVPAGDLTDDSGPGPDEELYTVVHVGFEGGRGGTYGPDTILRDVALKALEKARGVSTEVWAAIGDKLVGRERQNYNEASIAMHFTCVGPLAAATLAFGVLGVKDGEGPGDYMHGQDMNQEPHEEGVWGQRVAYVQFEGPKSEEVDLSDGAHEERAKELGIPDARYFIIARYD